MRPEDMWNETQALEARQLLWGQFSRCAAIHKGISTIIRYVCSGDRDQLPVSLCVGLQQPPQQPQQQPSPLQFSNSSLSSASSSSPVPFSPPAPRGSFKRHAVEEVAAAAAGCATAPPRTPSCCHCRRSHHRWPG